MTPHGANPTCHRLRDAELKTRQGGERVWEIFWRECVDSAGKSRWPERFTPKVIAGLKMNKRLWDTQYMLLRGDSGISSFDMNKVESGFWEWAVPGKLISYTRPVYDYNDLDEEGYAKLSYEKATISVDALR